MKLSNINCKCECLRLQAWGRNLSCIAWLNASQEIWSRRSREQQEIQGWIEKWSNFWNPKHLHFPWCWQSGTGRRIGFMHSIQGRLLFLARHVEKAHLQCNGGQSILGEKWGHIYMHRNQLGVKFMNGKKLLKKTKVDKMRLLESFSNTVLYMTDTNTC